MKIGDVGVINRKINILLDPLEPETLWDSSRNPTKIPFRREELSSGTLVIVTGFDDRHPNEVGVVLYYDHNKTFKLNREYIDFMEDVCEKPVKNKSVKFETIW